MPTSTEMASRLAQTERELTDLRRCYDNLAAELVAERRRHDDLAAGSDNQREVHNSAIAKLNETAVLQSGRIKDLADDVSLLGNNEQTRVAALESLRQRIDTIDTRIDGVDARLTASINSAASGQDTVPVNGPPDVPVKPSNNGSHGAEPSRPKKDKSRKKNDPPDDSSDESSESSSEEDDQHGRHHRKPSSFDSARNDTSSDDGDSAPKFPGLSVLRPRNHVLRGALSYRTYRLRNICDTYNDKIARKMHSFGKKVKFDMPADGEFNGDEPLEILKFLGEFKNACDNVGVSEGAAVRLLPMMMKGSARKGYENFLNRARRSKTDFYPHAIQYLLETYAEERSLEEEYLKIHRMRREPRESVHEFAQRIKAHAVKLGDLYDDNAQTTAFLAGVDEKIRSHFHTLGAKAKTYDAVVRLCKEGGVMFLQGSANPPAMISARRPVESPTPQRSARGIGIPRRPAALYASTEPATVPPTTSLTTDERADYGRITRPNTCHLCRETGHWMIDCPMLTEEAKTKLKAERAKRAPYASSRSPTHPQLPTYRERRPSNQAVYLADPMEYAPDEYLYEEMHEEMEGEPEVSKNYQGVP